MSQALDGRFSKMPDEELPPSVRQFIWQHVSSVEQLEILQLLAGRPAVEWTAQTVFKAVLTTVESIERALEKFAGGGLIERTAAEPPAYRLAGAKAEEIAQLCRFYAERPVRVVRTIYED